MTIHVLSKFAKTDLPYPSIDVTSSGGMGSKFSPFLLGPVMLYDRLWSQNMENGWQYSKLYPEQQQAHTYFEWARAGWDNPRAVRYPAGKGAKPLFSVWAGDALGYIEARKRIYIPLYSQAVRFYSYWPFNELNQAADEQGLIIRDYDAYDHRALGYSWDDVMNDPNRKMGHGFVLAMMLEGVL